MKLTLRHFTASILALLISSFAIPAMAGKGNAKPVPFKAKGVALPSIVNPGPPVEVMNELRGNATHLGKFAGSSIAFASVVGGVLHAEGTQTIAAADGSTLRLFITGDFPEGFQGPVTNGTYLIVGGTGRFSGATGSGAFLGEAVTDGVRPISYAGTIVK